MKRSTPTLRQPSEKKADNHKYYGVCARDAKKGISNVNPAFTRKPYEGVK